MCCLSGGAVVICLCIYLLPETLVRIFKKNRHHDQFQINKCDFALTYQGAWLGGAAGALVVWNVETFKATWKWQIEKYFPFASDIWAFNGFSSHLHEHMRSVFEMNFCECVRKLISSVCLRVVVCACAFVIARVSPGVWVFACLAPPPVRGDKVTVVFVSAGGKCDLLSHSYCLILEDVKHLSTPRPLSALRLCGIFPPLKLSPSPHLSLSLSDSPSPSFPLPSLRDGHLIHLTSWKDKYSLVECEAPASPLTQTGDEGKVSLAAELRRPNALIKSSTQPDTDMKMAAKTPTLNVAVFLLFRKFISFGWLGLRDGHHAWSHMWYFLRRAV